MNRLIILGNGFDLAHNLKTSFNSFISDYFCNAVNTFYKESKYEDPLLEIRMKYSGYSFGSVEDIATDKNIYERLNALNKNKNHYVLTFKSQLLQSIYGKTSQLKWVDIEIEFFEILLKTKKNNNIHYVDKLNGELEFLKKKLIDFLKIQQDSFSNIFNKDELVNCFCEEIQPHEIVTTTLEKKQLPENLYFLNFNYTNTFEDYMKICNSRIKSNFNYIHGSLGNIHGKPIFGFGDELDKRYVEFEDEHNNALFKHIKSFEYLKNKNYYLLTRFVESADFQIHIYGHSCGISDRTMLNQIFEHENCKSIKIFYYKINEELDDYTDKIYEISRHFKDKGVMRKKIIPHDLSKPMPQPVNVLSTTSVNRK